MLMLKYTPKKKRKKLCWPQDLRGSRSSKTTTKVPWFPMFLFGARGQTRMMVPKGLYLKYDGNVLHGSDMELDPLHYQNPAPVEIHKNPVRISTF